MTSIKIPQKENRNIVIFYIITVFTNAFYIAGNWIFFWTLFMTYKQLGFVDAVGFAFAFLMEIPTGAIADLLGKKITIQSALLFIFLGIMIITFGGSFLAIFVGFLIAQLGWTLYSGSAEALAYDSLVENKKQEDFEVVISFSHMLGLITTVIATLIGAWLFTINIKLPHFIWALTYLVGFIASFGLREPKVDTEKFSIKNYIKQLSTGIKELFSLKLKRYILFILTLMGFYYLYDYGLVRPVIAIQFGFFNIEQSFLYALTTILSAITVVFLPTIKRFLGDFKGLILLTIILTICFVLFSVRIGVFGVFPMLLIAIVGELSIPWISSIINEKTPSKYRATTISTVAMIIKTPYIIVAIVAGQLVEEGKFHYFTLTLAGLAATVLLISVIMNTYSKSLPKLNKSKY